VKVTRKYQVTIPESVRCKLGVKIGDTLIVKSEDNHIIMESSKHISNPSNALWNLFGPDRAIYGSNWPVSNLVAPYASMYKIGYPVEFAQNIASYQIVPFWAVNLLAIVMPWTELICGILLVVGLRSKSAVAIIAGMLLLFTLAILLSLLRSIPIGCGCFHSMEEPMSWTTLLRDLIWLAMAIHIYRFDSAFQLERKFLITIKDE